VRSLGKSYFGPLTGAAAKRNVKRRARRACGGSKYTLCIFIDMETCFVVKETNRQTYLARRGKYQQYEAKVPKVGSI
jgi:hypothetical protein